MTTTHSTAGGRTGSVAESIYSGSVVLALADVQHCELHLENSVPGMHVITSHTKYNFEHDCWENPIWINEPEATRFRAAWCRYRSELEADTLADLSLSSERLAIEDAKDDAYANSQFGVGA